MKNKLSSLTAVSSFLLLCIVLFFPSCRSNMDLTILKDVGASEGPSKYPELPPPYLVKSNDNLFVSIISSSPEMNELYNPSVAGSGRTQMGSNIVYNEVPGQYVFGYQVDSNGDIVLPLVGKVAVRGLTLLNAEEAISVRAKEFLKELTVKVRLLNFRITVMGEVTRPGVYYNYNAIFTVMDAISMANGITNYADLQKVLLVRPTPEGSQTYYLDLSSKESLSSPGYFLQPNDILIIEPSKYKNVQLRLPIYQIVISSVAAALLFVSIMTR
jgi:polysaccharide biosynthesis/export protein